jgi:orotate phosphoribosyltransferase-like protein
MAKDLSEEVRGQAIPLSNKGFTQGQIAAKIGVSKCSAAGRGKVQKN